MPPGAIEGASFKYLLGTRTLHAGLKDRFKHPCAQSPPDEAATSSNQPPSAVSGRDADAGGPEKVEGQLDAVTPWSLLAPTGEAFGAKAGYCI